LHAVFAGCRDQPATGTIVHDYLFTDGFEYKTAAPATHESISEPIGPSRHPSEGWDPVLVEYSEENRIPGCVGKTLSLS
jgi:hypothetical protein